MPPRLAAALDMSAARVPDQPALVDVTRSTAALTYYEWSTLSAGFASGLPDCPAETFVLHFDEHELIDFAVAFLGVLRAGHIALPMSNRFSPAEVAAAAERHGCAAVVVGPLMEAAEPSLAARTLTMAEVSGTQPSTAAAEAGPDGSTSGGCIIYTSGTTGSPKSVWCSATDLFRWVPRLGAGARPYLYQFPFDTAAGISSLLRAIRQYTAVHVPLLDAGVIFSSVARYCPKELALTPAGVRALMRSSEPAPAESADVESVIVTSAACGGQELEYLRAAFPRAGLLNLYSSTEAGIASTMRLYRPGDPIELGDCSGLVPVGRPTPWSAARITDSQDNEVVPGVLGSVWLRAAFGSSRRYFGTADAQPERPTFQDGWVRTGDVGLIDEAGELHLAGREADTINKGGVNVSAMQVEAVLRQHPAVRDSAVFALGHDMLGEEIHAAVTCSGPLTEDSLRRHVSERLGRFKTPARVMVVAELPVNSMGKVVKRKLQDQLTELLASEKGAVAGHSSAATGPAAAAASVGRRTGGAGSMAGQVERIWHEAFAGREDNGDFFENGGDSLTAIEIAARIEREMNIELSPIDVLENPTPGGLADLISVRQA
jgi:acyl-coenzyme A synthetase/AMP-(fatty) acid ligase/acyl carrier protein